MDGRRLGRSLGAPDLADEPGEDGGAVPAPSPVRGLASAAPCRGRTWRAVRRCALAGASLARPAWGRPACPQLGRGPGVGAGLGRAAFGGGEEPWPAPSSRDGRGPAWPWHLGGARGLAAARCRALAGAALAFATVRLAGALALSRFLAAVRAVCLAGLAGLLRGFFVGFRVFFAAMGRSIQARPPLNEGRPAHCTPSQVGAGQREPSNLAISPSTRHSRLDTGKFPVPACALRVSEGDRVGASGRGAIAPRVRARASERRGALVRAEKPRNHRGRPRRTSVRLCAAERLG